MSELVLYTNPQSRGRIVHWMLEEVGEPYRVEWLEYGPEGTKSDSYLAINPMGKVPSVTCDGAVVTEVPAICAWLAARFPDKGLMPVSHSPQLASYFRWLFFAAGPIEQAVTASAMGWEVPPESMRTVGFGNREDTFNTAELALQPGPYICGEQFTAADVYLASHLYFGMTFGGVDKRPAYEEYVARVTSRPAFGRAEKAADERMAAS